MSGRRGRKRNQSNADEVIAKRSKTTNNDDDEESEVTVEPQQLKKAATKGKGKQGKKTRCVMYVSVLIKSLQCFGRMTAAQRAAKDDIEDAKGVPANLTPYVLFFGRFSFFFSLSNLIHFTQQG